MRTLSSDPYQRSIVGTTLLREIPSSGIEVDEKTGHRFLVLEGGEWALRLTTEQDGNIVLRKGVTEDGYLLDLDFSSCILIRRDRTNPDPFANEEVLFASTQLNASGVIVDGRGKVQIYQSASPVRWRSRIAAFFKRLIVATA